MTLAPVFRSQRGLRLLLEGGLLARLAPALERQRAAVLRVRQDLAEVLGEDHRGPVELGPPEEFLQRFFFLTLFCRVFEALGVPESRLDLYAELDFCVMGTVAAADNLFDGEEKMLLPLRAQGAVFSSVLQLLCFDRLADRAGRRAVARGDCDEAGWATVRRDLLDAMAAIGALEGREEAGVEDVLPPEAMLEAVHRVRGGQLFGLAAVAPRRLEDAASLAAAEEALLALGTGFQVVDDLADFEEDLRRRTQNLLVSWIVHRGSAAERAALDRWRLDGPDGPLEQVFADSARAVLGEARRLVRGSFARLRALGLDLPEAMADQVVLGIVGEGGAARVEALGA